MIKRIIVFSICSFLLMVYSVTYSFGYVLEKMEPTDILSVSQQELKDNFNALAAGTADTAGTGLSTWQIDDADDTDKKITAGNDDATKPYIVYVATQDTWALSNTSGTNEFFMVATDDNGLGFKRHSSGAVWGENDKLCFEGNTADGFETCFLVIDPTADRTVTLNNSDFSTIGLQAKAGAFSTDGTTGNEVITGTGFQPKMVILSSSEAGANAFENNLGLGDCTTAVSTAWAGNETGPQLQGDRSTSAIVVTNTGGSQVYSATITCDSNGFTLNDSADSATTDFVYIAIA